MRNELCHALNSAANGTSQRFGKGESGMLPTARARADATEPLMAACLGPLVGAGPYGC